MDRQKEAKISLSMIIYPLSLWSIIVCLVLIITLIELKQMTIVEQLAANLTDNTNMTEFIRDQTKRRDAQMKAMMQKIDDLERAHDNPVNASDRQR